MGPVVGHVQIVDTSHIFSPPNDLPDKPFYSSYRGTFLVIRCLYLSDDLKGVEEAEIERSRDQRVKKEYFGRSTSHPETSHREVGTDQ